MKIRTICMIAAVTWLIPIGGCETDSAQRLAWGEQALAELRAQSALLGERLTDLEAFLATAQAALADPNVTDATAQRIAAEIATAQAELAKVGPVKAQVDAVLADVEAKVQELRAGGDVDFTDELQVVATLLTSAGAAIGGETGQWLRIGAMILTALVTLLGGALKVTADRRKVAETALLEVVTGGELLKRRTGAMPTEAASVVFRDAMGDAQTSASTVDLVARLKPQAKLRAKSIA